MGHILFILPDSVLLNIKQIEFPPAMHDVTLFFPVLDIRRVTGITFSHLNWTDPDVREFEYEEG